MGNTHEVSVWYKDNVLGYTFKDYYRGESFFRAFISFLKAKREGYGCVKWEYR